MKKLIQLCRFIDLHFVVHESRIGVCSVRKKLCLQIKLEMDESAIHCFIFNEHPAAASLMTIPKESSINWRQLSKL
jgi:hypothetical protein